MASIKDIAREAKVSPSTVSLVLNGRAEEIRISPSTKQKVLDTAKKLDYYPNLAGRKLREDNSYRVPIIVLFWSSNTTGVMADRLLNGIKHYKDTYNKEFQLMIQPYSTDELNKHEQVLKSTSMFNGALITGCSTKDIDFLNGLNVKMPIIITGRSSEKYNSCSVNEYQAGYNVAKLFKDRGHKNIGVVAQNIVFQKYGSRTSGFLDGCREYGLEVKKENQIVCHYSIEESGEAIRKVIERGRLPSAIFFEVEMLAIGALPIFHEYKLRIPEDLEIVTFGDAKIASYTIPSLTTIRTPLEEMVSDSVGILIDDIENRLTQPVNRIYETTLVMRQSCGSS